MNILFKSLLSSAVFGLPVLHGSSGETKGERGPFFMVENPRRVRVIFLTKEQTTMDKVFSTRLDESVVARISGLARRLQTSKKQVIEEAAKSTR